MIITNDQDLALQYQTQFGETIVPFNPFTVKKTGLIQTQTLLKMDSYTLMCVPFRMTMKEMTLIMALSRDEIAFFAKYVNTLAGLSLSFQLATQSKPLQLFSRCTVVSLNPVKGKDTTGLITVAFKPIPKDLILILGEYLMTVERLKAEYGDYANQTVRITPDSIKIMGFNNYATLQAGNEQCKLALFSMTSKWAEALLPPKTNAPAEGTACSIKLFFQKYQFTVGAVMCKVEHTQTGVIKARFNLEFSPELVEILEGYHLTARVQARKAASEKNASASPP